jgi:hypothetical protein
LWALKPPANLRGSIPLPYVTIFLMVALDEGKSVRGVDERHQANAALCSNRQILPARSLFFCRQWLGRTHL